MKEAVFSEAQVEWLDEEALYPTGMRSAIIGADTKGRAIISVERVIKHLMEKEGMTQDEAEEWFWHNIECAYHGEMSPVYMYERSAADMS